ncbi:YitT family protein [Microaerobacter geothermalis]|uniref:YitT family protein n=1 Tax=Microaerobacter geothermalis TaxID=674972 RepID=UPI001F490634|nr:YitT family protein [Microaerobacter geothermalis]MCF6093299.1 YitT family protein [Microaerobacter geothermalis]
MFKKMYIYCFHIVLIIIGSFVNAIAFNYLILPNNILSGGLTGITIVINHFTGLGIGLLYFLFNIPIFLIGYKQLGTRFVIYSAIAVVSLSAMIDLISPVNAYVTNDALLASIYGGLLLGAGVVIWLKIGGSGGGMDIISILLNRKYGYSVGQVMLILNGLIVMLSVFLYSLEQAMYTLIAIFVTSKMVDALQTAQSRRTAMIISNKPKEITEEIWSKLQRGVTYLDGSGAYSNTETKIILCVMTRFEIKEIKEIVLSIDPKAFITISTTDEVVGSFRSTKYHIKK